MVNEPVVVEPDNAYTTGVAAVDVTDTACVVASTDTPSTSPVTSTALSEYFILIVSLDETDGNDADSAVGSDDTCETVSSDKSSEYEEADVLVSEPGATVDDEESSSSLHDVADNPKLISNKPKLNFNE